MCSLLQYVCGCADTLIVPGSTSQFADDALFNRPRRCALELFIDGEQFYLAGYKDVSVHKDGDVGNSNVHDMGFHVNATQDEIQEMYIDYQPIVCRDVHSHTDLATNATCICDAGFELAGDATCHVIQCAAGEVMITDEYGVGYCTKCGTNEQVTTLRGIKTCTCKPGTVNSTKGSVSCFNKDACIEKVDHEAGLVCVKCPDCLDCGDPSEPIVKPGFGLTPMGQRDFADMFVMRDLCEGTSMRTDVQLQDQSEVLCSYEPRQLNVFTCPIEGSCLGDIPGRSWNGDDGYPSLSASQDWRPCKAGHKADSPFCTLCETDWMGGNDEACEPCDAVSSAAGQIILVVLALVGGLTGIYCGHSVYMKLERRMRESNVAYTEEECEVVGSFGRNASLIVYMKVICSHLQLLHQFPVVLDLEFPAAFKLWLERLSFFTLDLFKLFSVQCTFETNLYNKFLVTTCTPILALAALAAWSFMVKKVTSGDAAKSDVDTGASGLSSQLAATASNDINDSDKAQKDNVDQFLQRAFILLFAVYPMLSTKTFHFFACRHYDEQFLHMFDYSVSCDSDEYASYKPYAAMMVLVYPIGILVVFAALLYLNRARIRRSETMYDRSSDGDERWFEGGSHKFRFLVADYRKEYFWYEVFEYARKLVFTFMLGFADQGTASQIFGGLMAAVFFLVFNALAQPFADFRVNYLRVLADIQLSLTMAGCLMLKVDLDCDNLSPDFIAWFLIIINIFLTALALSLELVRRLLVFVVGTTGLHGVLYYPRRVLGRGKDSVVFEGEWRPLSDSFGVDLLQGYSVAVKQCTSCASDAIAMLMSITHDNVRMPLMIEQGTDGHFYIVSELCDHTLSDAIADKTIPTTLVEVCRQIVDGVCRTHAAGILHTSLTPDNIVLDGNTAKISGWGSCRSLADWRAEASELPHDASRPVGIEAHTHNPLGSSAHFLSDVAVAATGSEPGWQAPELLSKSHVFLEAGALIATDTFTLGCTLFFILSGGDHPFGADVDARNANILSGQHLVHDLSTTLSEDAKDLIASMLEYDNDKRITMQAVREHPFFWTDVQKVEYLGAQVGDVLVPKVHRSSFPFLQALEEAIDMRLGGQYVESESKTCSSWARLLDSRYPLTGKWQGQAPPQDVEHNYHVFGSLPSRKQADARQQQLDNGTTTQAPMEIRSVGLMKFIRNGACTPLVPHCRDCQSLPRWIAAVCVAHRIQMVESGQFESEGAVMRCKHNCSSFGMCHN
eukprot:COSAG02_NODE_3120_length_7329_cov_2.938866_2_plen_1239_part_00